MDKRMKTALIIMAIAVSILAAWKYGAIDFLRIVVAVGLLMSVFAIGVSWHKQYKKRKDATGK